MKRSFIATLFVLPLLAGCVSWERPYVSDDGACDEIVDQRDRLDCLAAAEQAEDDWREEKRREDEWKDKES
ncbi:hypothetical protein WNY37_16020 [Henriciella sp. AS95]|uniref:hypothetical protein n=1 Tax=Henriciella sp. AS95 TaxID=3135782 RepID=UPI00318073B2